MGELPRSGSGGDGPDAGRGDPHGGAGNNGGRAAGSSASHGLDGAAAPGAPAGDVYEWFRRGSELLTQGHPAAAEQLLARAAQAEPRSRSVREALARAQFDSGSYRAALENFRTVALEDPADHYAQFGWGLAAARIGDFETSAEHLALAVALRPGSDHYRAALRQTRATLRARAGAFGTVGNEPTVPDRGVRDSARPAPEDRGRPGGPEGDDPR